MCPFIATQVFSGQADAPRKSNDWRAMSREWFGWKMCLEEHLQKLEDETAAEYEAEQDCKFMLVSL
jgi:hypothetical protein